MVVSLPPAKPSIVAAAKTASASLFLDIGVSCDDLGNAFGQRMRVEVPD
jgi:hypothetical protein